jgi:hypothetical protein
MYVGIILWSLYGTHYEAEDSDPIHGIGEWVTDFDPTMKQRNEIGLKIFVILLIPVWFGVSKAHSRAS